MRVLLLALAAAIPMLLACGLSSDGPEVLVYRVPELPYGPKLLEEEILESPVIVRATMTSMSSEVLATSEGKFIAVLKFNLSVAEYLKGTGPSGIVAMWLDGNEYDSRSEADKRKAAVVATRDAQWDDREAVIFLYDRVTGFGTEIDAKLALADHFLLSRGDRYSHDDGYSLHSERSKEWLPAAVSSGAGQGAGVAADAKEYLLEVPSASEGTSSSSTDSTITLSALKTRISEIAAEHDRGGESAAYQECLRLKYEVERGNRYFKREKGRAVYDQSPVKSALTSGQPSGTLLYERYNDGFYPDQKAKTWLEGKDAALFAVVQGTPTPMDVDGDGKFTAGTDGIYFKETFTTARPLPGGEYSINRREVWSPFLLCDYVLDNDWTITVTAPGGTLHEMFFDPVAVSTAVAADATNGVLKPRAFTGASGASATISRIAYEPSSSGSGKSAQVKIGVTPDGALSGQVVDFIGLDGTVSLTLSVASATADSAAGTLTWPISTQPWKAGDKLMVRIGPPPPAPAAPTSLTAAAGNARVTLAWDDPSNTTITGYEYQMRWTGVGWQAWVAVPNSGASTTSHAVTGLTNGTEYRFKVRAVNAGGSGQAAPSADPWYVAATPQAPPPAAPTGLAAVAGKGSVTLTWDDPSDSSITRYEYRMRWTGVGWQDWVAIPNSGAKTTSHAVTGLTNGTEHRFQLRAVNAAGAGQNAPNAHPWYVSATPQAPKR